MLEFFIFFLFVNIFKALILSLCTAPLITDPESSMVVCIQLEHLNSGAALATSKSEMSF